VTAAKPQLYLSSQVRINQCTAGIVCLSIENPEQEATEQKPIKQEKQNIQVLILETTRGLGDVVTGKLETPSLMQRFHSIALFSY
jgi:UDP-N-acetyl-D-mannosaminuronic acid transferase (WecB/TagA/CpsF family)